LSAFKFDLSPPILGAALAMALAIEAAELMEHFGFSVDAVVAHARRIVADAGPG